MRFPFISRALHDERVADLNAFISELRTALYAERARSDTLTSTLIDMKVGGATLMRARADALDRVQQSAEAGRAVPRSAIAQAIEENKHAAANRALRQHLTRWAERQIENGHAEDIVLRKLRSWSVVTPAEDEPDDDDEFEDDDVIATGARTEGDS
jgi:hypothetical protein